MMYRRVIKQNFSWLFSKVRASPHCGGSRGVLLFLLALFVVATERISAQSAGKFVGELVLKALPDGRNMELVQPFSYVDSAGVAWPVPSRTVIDGASIPSPFWSLIGAPFTGKFREASVIHDYYCQKKSRHWKAVHKVFYDGMNARQVDSVQAKLMYIAVYRFGPRWDFDANACFCAGCPVCANPVVKRIKSFKPKYNTNDLDELKRRLEKEGADLATLERLADYQVNTEIFGGR